jgi:tRNA G18 (ribose-2'-O)-methylase SpoU
MDEARTGCRHSILASADLLAPAEGQAADEPSPRPRAGSGEGRMRRGYPGIVTTDQAEPAHGVGPWPGGAQAWPADDRYDADLLAHGDHRNVIDRYRYWRMAAIVADLDEHRHPFHVAIENWQHDMNIGSIVRSANAFGANTVHIIGKRRWNRRGAMVTDRYQHVIHHPDVATFAQWAAAASIPVIAVDNLPGAVPVQDAALPERCVLLFGQEGPGLSSEALDAAASLVEITQYGSTRSINASAAAAVIMYEWCRRWAQPRSVPNV